MDYFQVLMLFLINYNIYLLIVYKNKNKKRNKYIKKVKERKKEG